MEFQCIQKHDVRKGDLILRKCITRLLKHYRLDQTEANN
jgi:hypothetical protein